MVFLGRKFKNSQTAPNNQITISLIIGIKIATFEYIILIKNNEKTNTTCAVIVFVII